MGDARARVAGAARHRLWSHEARLPRAAGCMLNLTPARKQAIGGALGLLLLAFAFAYRWIGPEWLGLRPAPEAPSLDQPLAPEVAQAPATPAPAAPAAAPAAPDPATTVPKPRVDTLSAVSEEARAEVEDALARAEEARAAGRLIEPAGDSALYWYDAALELDPRNLAAKQGLEQIERAILQQALAAASDDRFADADQLMALAATVLSGTQAQLETRTRIVDLRTQRAGALLSRAEVALDARNLESAEALVTRAVALAADPARVEALRARIANARVYEHREPGEVFADPFLDRAGDGPELVVLPLGEFEMGSPESERGRKDNEGPRHAVSIVRAFALGRYEVTVAQFRRFVLASGYVTDAERAGESTFYDESSGRLASGKGIDWRRDYRGEEAQDGDPVVHVSFSDANAYAVWISSRTGKHYRLPSEAEWEYAERAGSTARYAWGPNPPTRPIGNFTGDGDRSVSGRSWTRAFQRYSDGYWGPAPVGTYAANAFGLHDMSGNVSEWVEDCWHDSYRRAPTDGTPWVNPGCGRRVVRGGSWGSAPDQTRSAFRLSAATDTRSARVGFRVARDL